MTTTTPTALRLFDWQRRVLACVVGPHAVAFVEAVLGPKQLTTGDDVYDVVTHDAEQCAVCAPCIAPLFPSQYLGPWPWPCSCAYYRARTHRAHFYETLTGSLIPTYNLPGISWFVIHSDCPQHGDDALEVG